MTNFEVVLEPHTDGCYKILSSSNGQAQAAGDCLYYDGQTFTETDTFTWTPPPTQMTLPLYAASSAVWWQGTLTKYTYTRQ